MEVAAAIFSTVLSSSLPWLYKAIDERRKKLKWSGRAGKLKLGVESIQLELELIQAAIRDWRENSCNDTNNLRRTWIAQLRRLAYDIEDCVDQFHANKMKGEELATMIAQLNERAVKMHEELLPYTRKEPQGTSSSSAQGPGAPARRDQHHHVVVGMEEPCNELKDLLWESDRPSERKLRVIFIVGFGGIGKTFLAEHVYLEQRNCFPRSAFVHTAGKDEKKILDEILKKLHQQDAPMDVAQLRRKEVLEEKPKKLYQQAANHCQQEMLQVGINSVHGDPSVSNQQRTHQAGCAGSCPTYGQQLLCNRSLVGRMKREEGENAEVKEEEEAEPAIPFAAAYTSSTNDFSQHMCEPSKRLKSSLGTDRYLIVIDDVQTEELVQNIISSLPQAPGVDSRVIVTTSIHKVAESNLNNVHRHVYKVRPLNEKDSEDLFLKVACRNSPSYAEKQRSLAFRKYCDGVPLALVSLAQYCNGNLNKCEEAWRKLCKLEENRALQTMQQVLEHSFDKLSSLVLQDCLLYLCMFPWGHRIRSGALIRRWLAEGLLLPEDASDDFSLVDAAVRNLKILVDQNVIRPIKTSISGEVKTCQPLGVMHGYITSKSKSENLFVLSCGDGTPNPQDIRRLSLHHTSEANNVRVLEKDLSRLRTLAVFNKGEEDPLSFANCELLRVLDLEACPGLSKGHLDEICKLLRFLKYLSLGAGISKVPRKIAMLECLETLQVAKEKVVEVPPNVLKLPHLKHLLGKLKLREGYRGKKNLKEFLSSSSKLEVLAGFVVDGSPGFPQLMRHMSSLIKVKIWCSNDATPTNLTDLSHSIEAFLSKSKGRARSLSVVFYGCSEQFLNFAIAPVFLPDEDLTGGRGLSSLKLRGGMLTPVPAFVNSLCGITELCLSSPTLSWNEIAVGLSNLKILEYLKLVADENVEGDVVIQCEQFLSLKRLCIMAKESISQITIHDEALKHLVCLQLICPGLDGHSADQIRTLKKLREVTLHSGVAQATWKEAARKHPNRPNVVFMANP